MHCRLALAILLALAASAHAAGNDEDRRDRSDDYRDGYRRGYDDGFASGYRKGIEEAPRSVQVVPAPPPPPRATGPITVSSAQYGTSSKSCNATHQIARRVNGRLSASLEVTNEICGDPAKGERKELEVTYICGSIAKTASAYEHRTLYLDCTN